MASIELPQSVYYKLSNTSAVTTLVSTRIYPNIAPQKAALPYVTFSQISRVHAHAAGADAGTYMARVQVDSWADDYLEVYGVAKQVRIAFQDFMGSMAGASDTFTVQRIFYDGWLDLSEMSVETNEITYRVTQDFLVWHY